MEKIIGDWQDGAMMIVGIGAVLLIATAVLFLVSLAAFAGFHLLVTYPIYCGLSLLAFGFGPLATKKVAKHFCTQI